MFFKIGTDLINFEEKWGSPCNFNLIYFVVERFFHIFAITMEKILTKVRPWFGLLLLAMGGMVYVLFRPRTLLLFSVADATGIGSWADSMRTLFGGIQLPDWMVYSLPGGLWSAAYVLLVGWLMQGRALRWRLLATLPIPLVGALSELLQGAGVLSGTFDMGDVVCYLAPYLIYASLNEK